MNRFLAFSLAVLITPVVAKADFVIDDFATPTSLFNGFGAFVGSTTSIPVTPSSGVSRQLVYNSPGFLSVTIDAPLNGGMVVAAATGATVNVRYTFTQPTDFHSVGVSANPVRLGNFASVNGSWRLTASYTSSLLNSTAFFSDVTLVQGTDVYFDGRTLGNGLLASNVSQIDLLFTAIAAPDAFNPASFNLVGSFVATPEPASIALAGMAVSSIGGAGLMRRRKRNLQTEGLSV